MANALQWVNPKRVAVDSVVTTAAFAQTFGSVDFTGKSGSFTSGSGGEYPYTISSADVFIQRAGGVDSGHTVSVEIRSDSAGLPGTLLATSNSYDISLLPTPPANFTFTFSSGTSIAASTKYHVCVIVSAGDSHGNVVNIFGFNPSTGNSICTRDSGTTWSNSSTDWTVGFTLYHL